MIQIVKSEERGQTNISWLKSYHSFSFNDYYNPEQMNFGPLRVLNQDWIKPNSGFGMHPHRDMEIITYVLEGELEHEDSTGSKGRIHAGEVQRMTAGTGIFHSEKNQSKTDTVHLLQIWFMPNRNGYVPSYEQKQFTAGQRQNALLKITSNVSSEFGVMINQDVDMFVSHLDASKALQHTIDTGRGAYLFLIEGSLSINSHQLHSGDALKVTDEKELSLNAMENSEFVLFDMKM